MLISFAKKKVAKTFNRERDLEKAYGKRQASVIKLRMAVLNAAAHLGMVPTRKPERCHELDGERKEQFAVDLVHPQRLVFRPDHDPVPRLGGGGVDKSKVTAIVILDVINYH